MADVVFKLQIDDKEFMFKLQRENVEIKELRKEFEKTSETAGNTIIGLKNRVKNLTKEFERTEIGSEKFRQLQKELTETKQKIQEAEKEVEDVNKDLNNINNKTEGGSGSIIDSFSKWGNIITGINQGLEVASKIIGIINKPLTVAAEFERYEVQLGVILDGVRDVKSEIELISNFGKETPFQLPELVRSYKTLHTLSEGFLSTAEGLEIVGDVAAGTNQPIEELAVHFGRLQNSMKSGRPAGESLMRLQEIGALTGKTRNEIEKAIATGRDWRETWKLLTDDMSRYHGIMEEQSATYEGLLSNLEDASILLLATIGEKILPAAKKIIEDMIQVMESIEWVFKTSAELAVDAYNEQLSKVEELNKKIPELLDKYDKMHIALEQGIISQTKVKEIMNEIAASVPLAVTKWDEYGNAIEISRDKILKYLEAEKARLKLLNKDAIDEINNSIKNIERNIVTAQRKLNQGYEYVGRGTQAGGGLDKLNLSETRIREINDDIKIMNANLAEYNKQLRGLTGDDIVVPEFIDDNDSETSIKAIENELRHYQLKKELNELSLIDYERYLQNRLNSLEKTTDEEKEVYLKFQNELEKIQSEYGLKSAQELFDKVVKDAKPKSSLLEIEIEADEFKISTLEETQDAEVQLINDKYEAEYRVLELWKDRELQKYEDDQQQKLLIEKIYAKKREELAQEESDAKIESYLKSAEMVAGLFNKSTVVYKALMIARTGISTYNAAQAALEPPPIGLGPVAGIPLAVATTAAGLARVAQIAATEIPEMPGYAKGGIVVGEAGPEIIAPADSYAEHHSVLVSNIMKEVNARLDGLKVEQSFSSGLNNDDRALFSEMNNNLKNYLRHPIPVVIGDRAAQEIYNRGNSQVRRSR